MSALTMRSKITVRWTTNPADMGYDGSPSQWLSSPGEVMGIKRAARFAYDLSQRIGQGVFKRIQYQHGSRVVTLDEIDEVIATAEYRKYSAKN